MSTEYSLATYTFPSYDNSTRLQLYEILRSFENAAHPVIFTGIFTSFIGVFTTLVHLYVLSRRIMLKSSVISIMIGIGVCDLFALVFLAQFNILYLLIEQNEKPCDPPFPLWPFYAYWLPVVLFDLCRRCSTWLSVCMALLRWIVMRFGTRRTFRAISRVSFGASVSVGAFATSLPLSGLYYFRYDIVQAGSWTAMRNCTNNPPNGTYNIYTLVQSSLYTANDGFVGKVFQLVNGTVSKLLPCILLPLLTVFLVLELREARRRQRILNSSSDGPGTERTTGLVVFMTVSSFIIELPGGTVRVLQFFYTDLGWWRMATAVMQVVNAMFSINAALHGFIFYLMSSQYQKSVGVIFKRKEPRIIVAQSTLNMT